PNKAHPRLPQARVSCRSRGERSCRTTSAPSSRTLSSATSTRSYRERRCARSSHGCCGCSRRMATDHELRLRERLARLRSVNLLGGARLSAEVEKLQRQLERLAEETTDEDIWRSVELARHPDRPYTLDYVERLLDDWFELHGDRGRADDHAIVSGVGQFDGRTVGLVGQQKGRDIKDRIDRN